MSAREKYQGQPVYRMPNGKWQLHTRVGGQPVKRTFDDPKAAIRYLADVKKAALNGDDLVTSSTTVAGYYRMWLDRRVGIAPTTRHNYERFYEAHLLGKPLGSMLLLNVRRADIDRWGSQMLQTMTEQTFANCLIRFRGMFVDACRHGLPRNPCPTAKEFGVSNKKRGQVVPLTAGQVQAWADAAHPLVRPMILTQAMLGLRIGEAKALRDEDIDFARREVRIRFQRTQLFRFKLADTKTASSVRRIPLPDTLAAILRDHMAEHPPLDDGTVFYQDNRRPFSHTYQGGLYRAASAAAGLPPGTSSHDLRHHYASVLLAAGETVHCVAERLGNTASLVLDTYGHMMPGRDAATRHAIDGLWSKCAPDLATGRKKRDQNVPGLRVVPGQTA